MCWTMLNLARPRRPGLRPRAFMGHDQANPVVDLSYPYDIGAVVPTQPHHTSSPGNAPVIRKIVKPRTQLGGGSIEPLD